MNRKQINTVVYFLMMVSAFVLGIGSIYLRFIHIDLTSVRVLVMYWREYVVSVLTFTVLLVLYNKTI